MTNNFIEYFDKSSPYNTDNLYNRPSCDWLDAIQYADKYNQVVNGTISICNDEGVELVLDRHSGDITLTFAGGETRKSHMESFDQDVIGWNRDDLYSDGWSVKPARDVVKLADYR